MKKDFYQLLNKQVAALLGGESDLIAAMANFSALLYHELADINWLGFYLCKNQKLTLGPFQGKVACSGLPWNKGVCGEAAAQNRIMRVANVNEYPGHIACDSASQSEIVLPIVDDNRVVAVLDIDSPIINRFDEEDEYGLSLIVKTFENCIK